VQRELYSSDVQWNKRIKPHGCLSLSSRRSFVCSGYCYFAPRAHTTSSLRRDCNNCTLRSLAAAATAFFDKAMSRINAEKHTESVLSLWHSGEESSHTIAISAEITSICAHAVSQMGSCFCPFVARPDKRMCNENEIAMSIF
jgi:hypothetical protein